MTDEELEAAQSLANAATPGPWCVQGPWPQATIYLADAAIYDDSLQPTHIATSSRLMSAESNVRDDQDAQFIAASRTLVPQLIAALREARIDLRCARIQVADRGASYQAVKADADHMRPVFDVACSDPEALGYLSCFVSELGLERGDLGPELGEMIQRSMTLIESLLAAVSAARGSK